MTKPIAGPDPRPKRPRLKVPAQACDCHSHIFGPAARYPYDPNRMYTPPDCLLPDYLRVLGTLGVERTVIVQPSPYGSDNSCTEDAIRALGARARGVAVVDPEIAPAEARRLDSAGFRGIRFNLVHAGGSTPLDHLEKLAGKAADFGWHVQLYLKGHVLLPVIESRLKGLPAHVVIDHMGHLDAEKGVAQEGFQALLRLLATGRCWVKLSGAYRFDMSGPPYRQAVPIARALVAANPDRLVWGTDWPHPDIPGPRADKPGPMPNDGDLLDALLDWAPDEGVRRRILCDNPAALYGFE